MKFWRKFYAYWIDSGYYWWGDKFIRQGAKSNYELVLLHTGYMMILPTGLLVFIGVKLLGVPYGALRSLVILLAASFNIGYAIWVKSKLMGEHFVENRFEWVQTQGRETLHKRSLIALFCVQIPSLCSAFIMYYLAQLIDTFL